MGRRLERRIDNDLVDRILASGPIKKQRETKAKKTPRPHFTYRQNGRGTASSIDLWAAPKSAFKGPYFAGAIYLNRARNWPNAKSYQHAREIGPSAEPVR